MSLPLTFMRLEPFVIPKASLTGINVERVDTRVAQIIYAVDPQSRPVQGHKLLADGFIDTSAKTAPPQLAAKRSLPAASESTRR
jgi:HlyD family secretion protein